ncbi:MAG: acetone carboxylase subunit alpha, partial [Promethearchaeota archaeon]
PLERKIEFIKKDLEDEIYAKDIVFKVYGVVAEYNVQNGEWLVDENATKTRRKQLRNERRENSVTFEEFWERERQKITENKLSKPVKLMFSESLELSDEWGQEFRKFWKLPNDFKMEVK